MRKMGDEEREREVYYVEKRLIHRIVDLAMFLLSSRRRNTRCEYSFADYGVKLYILEHESLNTILEVVNKLKRMRIQLPYSKTVIRYSDTYIMEENGMPVIVIYFREIGGENNEQLH